jgi:mannosyltransferase OCH1-like enzyme
LYAVGGDPAVIMIDLPHFSERIKKEGPSEINGVPLNIYQTFDKKVHHKMNELFVRLKLANPEFNHYLYTEEECMKFISENFSQEIASAYDNLIPHAYKSDLWRYCILYKLGGVYLDVKFYTTQSLFDIINKHSEIFVKYTPKTIIPESYIDKKIQIYNGFMVSPPNNQIFKAAIDAIVKNTKEKNYTEGPLDITGPMLLVEIVRANKPPNYIEGLPFILKDADIHNAKILLDGKELCVQLPDYREIHNKTSAQPHYSELWKQKKVYK